MYLLPRLILGLVTYSSDDEGRLMLHGQPTRQFRLGREQKRFPRPLEHYVRQPKRHQAGLQQRLSLLSPDRNSYVFIEWHGYSDLKLPTAPGGEVRHRVRIPRVERATA